MPRSRQRTSSPRNRKIVLAIGGVVAGLVLIAAGFAIYSYFTGVGSDELPSAIGSNERADIEQAARDFFDDMNQYNPQLVWEGMRHDDSYATTLDAERLNVSVSSLISEQLKFQVQGLGPTQLDSQAGLVRARVVTNLGAQDLALKRRDGDWRVTRVPDFHIPQDAGPLKLEWEITNSFHSDDGKLLHVAGRLRNTSNGMGYFVGAGGYILDEEGHTLANANQPLAGTPFIRPGEETYFQVSLRQPEGYTLDPARLVLSPDFRPATVNDEAPVTATLVGVTPTEGQWPALAGSRGQVVNGEARGVDVRVFAYVFDNAGRFLSVYALFASKVAAGAQRQFDMPAALPRELVGAARFDIRAYATYERQR